MSACGIDGTAVLTRDLNATPRWDRADEAIHVAAQLRDDPTARAYLAELYDPGEWCEHQNAFHYHRHHREETP